MSMKNSNYTIGNRTRDLPPCSAVPQPTALRRAPVLDIVGNKILFPHCATTHCGQSEKFKCLVIQITIGHNLQTVDRLSAEVVITDTVSFWTSSVI